MIEGAAILLAGMVIGALADRLLGRSRRPERAKPICACGHSIGHHDPTTGRCQAGKKIQLNLLDQWIRCACHRYVGPEPLPSVFAQEITGIGNDA